MLHPFTQHKWFFWLVAAAALAGLILLAGSLDTLELRHGAGVPAALAPMEQLAGGSSLSMPPETLTILVILVFSLLLISLTYVLLSPEARPRFFRQMSQLLLLVLFMVVAGTIFRPGETPAEEELLPGAGAPEAVTPDLETDTLPPPEESPPWLAWALSFSLSGLALLLGLRWWLAQQQPPPPSEEALARAARQALQALQRGESLADVIMRCYAEMLAAVAADRGLRRPEHLTAREFERSLIEAGLPAADVDDLTHLFEFVRYSRAAPTPQQEQRAIACLSALTQALSAPAEAN